MADGAGLRRARPPGRLRGPVASAASRDDASPRLLPGGVLAGVVALTGPRLRERLDDPAFRNAIRGATDSGLLVVVLVVGITGLALQYAARALRGEDAYWLVVVWHSILSALLLGLILAHATFNRRPFRAHVGLIQRPPLE